MPTNVAQDERGATILVAAEQENYRDLLRDILEAYGYRVVSCATLLEAAAAAIRERCDLAVVELDRPASAQMEALQWLRRSRPDSKILAVLGDASLAPLEPLADAIVWKPFSVDHFISIVASFIGTAERSEKVGITPISSPCPDDRF